MRLLVASVALALVASTSSQRVCERVVLANTTATSKCARVVVPAVPDDADPSEADALARCACAYARRACDLRDATCEIRGGCAPSPSEDLACLVPLCELCDDVPVPEGAPRERLCRLCRREMDRGLVAARVDPLWTTWTYGWYSAWLVFLAVDAVVAASLAGGGLGQPYWGYVPYDNTSHPSVPEVIGTHGPEGPSWSQSTYSPYEQPYVISPTAPAAGSPPPPPPPPPPVPAETQLCAFAEFSAELQNVVGTLLPCLAGASAACCAAVAAAVGPSPSATLPDCLCNPQAFETVQTIMLQAAGVDAEALLERCDDAHDVAIAFPAAAGDPCGARVAKPNADRQSEDEDDHAVVDGQRRFARRRASDTKARERVVYSYADEDAF